MQSVIRSSLIYAAIYGPCYLILDAVDASEWLIYALAVTVPFIAGAIDRRIERRASD